MGRPFFVQEEEEPATTKTIITETVNTKKLPLLFFLGELSGETKHALFDPNQQTLNVVEFPELGSQIECISSGHGWLLLLSRETTSLFFFNPLTRERIELPYRNSAFNAVAFSAPPTSPNCTVFAIDTFGGKLDIHVLIVGNKWSRYEYRSGTSQFGYFGGNIKVIFSKEMLLLMDSRGRMGSFDVNNGWKTLSGKELKHVPISYLLEVNGEVLGIKNNQNSRDIESVHKLKFEDGLGTWEEVKDIGDVTMFLGAYGSCVLAGLNDELNKKIFVARDDPESKCVIYENNGGDYKKTKRFDATPFSCSYAPVWIERSS